MTLIKIRRNKQLLIPVFLIGFYIISRIYIWQNPPPAFSEIIYSYMPYAHLWASGTRPYLDVIFEYPPHTIPLFYLPHLIDMATLHTVFHLNYSEAYRLQILFVDILIFILIWVNLSKFKVNMKVKSLGLIFYILATSKANHFIYDSMDIVFSGAVLLSVISNNLFKNIKGLLASWIGYFLAFGLKYINAPLGLILLFFNKVKFKQNLLIAVFTFVMLWSLPLLYFRSSLSVSFFYHSVRGLQIDSTGATASRIIDNFTKSETIIEQYKNYDITGPVSTVIKKIFDLIFPLSIALYLIWAINLTFKHNHSKLLLLYLSIGYLLLFLITGKVLSRPFILWLIPLLTAYPYPNLKTALRYLISYLVIVVLTTTFIPRTDLLLFNSDLWINIIKTSIFIYLFISWIKMKDELLFKNHYAENN